MPTADPPPHPFDRTLLRRRLARAAPGFSRADFLFRATAEDLAERVSCVDRRFARAIDLAARRGAFAAALAAGSGPGRVDFLIEADLSEAMLRGRPGVRLVADEERLPLAPAGVDLVVSALALHWVNDLVGALVQIRRALRPDGLFLGALFGGSTLTELRAVLLEAEVEVTGGAGPRVSPMADARDLPALMQRAGFALPVVDVDRLTARYDHVGALMADLRAMGQASVLSERPSAPLSLPVLARAGELYRDRHGRGGRIAATFEVITLTGWAPAADQPRPLKPGPAQARLADALGQAERSAGEAAAPSSPGREVRKIGG